MPATLDLSLVIGGPGNFFWGCKNSRKSGKTICLFLKNTTNVSNLMYVGTCPRLKTIQKQFSNKSYFLKHNKCDITWFDVCVGETRPLRNSTYMAAVENSSHFVSNARLKKDNRIRNVAHRLGHTLLGLHHESG